MNQEELYKDKVTVPIKTLDGIPGKLVVDGPFESGEDLFNAIVSMPGHEKIDLNVLMKDLELHTIYSGDPIECPKPSCPECGSINIVKSGFKVNKKGKHQRYQCNDCGYNFIRGDSDEEAVRGDKHV